MKFVEEAPIGVENYKGCLTTRLEFIESNCSDGYLYCRSIFSRFYYCCLNMSFRGNATVRAIMTLPYAIP